MLYSGSGFRGFGVETRLYGSEAGRWDLALCFHVFK